MHLMMVMTVTHHACYDDYDGYIMHVMVEIIVKKMAALSHMPRYELEHTK